MINTALYISILAFIGTALLFTGIFYYVTYREKSRTIIDKLRGEKPEETADITSAEERGPGKHFLKIVGNLGNLVKPKKKQDIYSMRMSLLRAGYRNPQAGIIFSGLKAFFAILLPALFSLGRIFIMESVTQSRLMALSIFLALIGFYLPNVWLQMKIGRRKEKILEGLPDALDLMVVCVEAGMGLDAALTRVGEEMRLKNEVLSDEFRQLSLELRAGKPRSDALRNLAVRSGLDDVSSLITLLIQTDRFGTSVAQALRVHSDSMRTKRYQRAEEIAAKLPVKLVFPLVFFIFPALFVVIVGPAVIKIMRHMMPLMGQ